MFGKLFGKFGSEIGIDLGTANTLVYVRGKGIIINEPSVVAVNTRNGQILAVGTEAREMIGKTPQYVVTSRPLTKGIISDFEVTERMLRFFLERAQGDGFRLSARPRVVIGIPLDITEVERKAVEDAVLGAGAKEVALIEEPMAAAIGAGLPVEEPMGSMVVDIGGGTTDIAVISLSGIVTWKSLSIAGEEFNKNIVHYAREEFNLMIGERVAESAKIGIGSAADLKEPLTMSIRGRDILSGLPREIMINDGQIREAIGKSVRSIVEQVKAALEQTPPELVADIYEKGIVLAGGGALLRNLDVLLSKEAEIPVRVADDPLTAVVRGAGIVLDNPKLLEVITVPSTRDE